MKNFIFGIIGFILYVQCRLIHLPIFWLGFPSIQMWITQNEMMRRHIISLIFVWLNLVLFYFFSWWVLLFILIQILTIFVIIKKTTAK